VGVAAGLLSRDGAGYARTVRTEYEEVARLHAAQRGPSRRLPLAEARANKAKFDWKGYRPPKPAFPGVHSFTDYDLGELAKFIDWTPFFQAWELKGKYPAILQDEKTGPAARSLFADAQTMLAKIVEEKWLTANAAFGLFRANSDGDDIHVFGENNTKLATLHTLRQQMKRDSGRPNLALADYVAPQGEDYIGAFAVTAGHGEDARIKAFEAEKDDYSAILLRALADRLAEAFAERLHARVRREFWGYAPDEAFSSEQLIAEEYRGIRPAPGYPAQPDHTEKAALFALLDGGAQTGVTLTENYAMWPGSSVSGFYFSHPEARYFGIGKIEKDQVEDYARRKGWSLAEAERWLAPILNYNPRAVVAA